MAKKKETSIKALQVVSLVVSIMSGLLLITLNYQSLKERLTRKPITQAKTPVVNQV